MNAQQPPGGISRAAAAGVSIAYNATLIVLKVAAAVVTGSVAILSEALNSTIDLVASVIAFVAVRRAEEPADTEHPYGHEKVESVAAGIEGILIIGGAVFILVESIRRLMNGNTEVESLGLGIAVIAFSGFIVLTGLNIIRRAAGILVDESPPPEEMDQIEAAIARARADEPEMVGYHKLRARTTGRRRYIDLHVQFRSGTTLERAHHLAHELRDAIESDLGDAEVLIHVEPESSRHDPAELPKEFRAG